jgi:hypothetical protein
MFYLISIFALTAGVFFLIWLGGLITKYGLGNGWALLLLVDVLAGFSGYMALMSPTSDLGGGIQMAWGLGSLLFILLVLGATLLLLRGTREVEGREPQQTFAIPLFQVGIIPLFLASGALSFLQAVLSSPAVTEAFAQAPDWLWILSADFQKGGWLYLLFYGFLILFFTYFYKNAVFHPQALSRAVRGLEGIPRVRNPALGAGLYLALIAILPYILSNLSGLPFFALAGATPLIIIGVLFDVVQRLRAFDTVPHREQDLQFVVVYRTLSHVQAHRVKGQLQRSGIPCLLQTLVPYPYLVFPMIGPVEAAVPAGQQAQAEEILQALLKHEEEEEELHIPPREAAIWVLLVSFPLFILVAGPSWLRASNLSLWISGAFLLSLVMIAGLLWFLNRRGYREYAYWMALLILLGFPSASIFLFLLANP